MKRLNLTASFLLLLAVFVLSSCEVIEGIFKAGVGVGIFIVLAVVCITAFIVIKIRKNKNS